MNRLGERVGRRDPALEVLGTATLSLGVDGAEAGGTDRGLLAVARGLGAAGSDRDPGSGLRVQRHFAGGRGERVRNGNVMLDQRGGGHAPIEEVLLAVADVARATVAAVAAHRAAVREPVA